MEIFEGHRALLRPLFDAAIALGNFDGVHRGHQRLLQATVAASRRLGGDSVVLTFDPHPARVLAPAAAPPLLTTRGRKLKLIAAQGLSACIVEPFTRELASIGADEFLQTIIVDVVRARYVVVGYDFTYGNQRRGTADTLRAFGHAHGIEIEVIEPVTVDGMVASSTRVREEVRQGNMAGARLLLGRDFDVDGTVVRGAGRGRTIGIPTANIDTQQGLILPAKGVYAVRARILDGAGDLPGRDIALPGVANLGTVPTFTDGERMTLEVHLMEFVGDLYGRTLRIEFVEKLRGEQRFDGVESLVAQIRLDIERARHILGVAS